MYPECRSQSLRMGVPIFLKFPTEVLDLEIFRWTGKKGLPNISKEQNFKALKVIFICISYIYIYVVFSMFVVSEFYSN